MLRKTMSKFTVLLLCIAMVFCMSSVSFADELTAADASVLLSEPQGTIAITDSQGEAVSRFSMDEAREYSIAVDFGVKVDPSAIRWSFSPVGGDEIAFSEFVTYDSAETPVLEVTDLKETEGTSYQGTLKVDSRFGIPSMMTPYTAMGTVYSERGDYVLKAAATADGAEVSCETTIRYEAYDSFRTTDEVYSDMDAIAEKANANGIYMSVETTGIDSTGLPVKEMLVAKDKAAVDKWLALTEEMETDPEAVEAKIKNGTLSDYQIPVYITNIHPNENPGVDASVNFLEKISEAGTIPYKTWDPENNVSISKTYDIKKILNDVILIVRPTENPYAHSVGQRGSVYGLDLNRDSTYQTQLESQIATADIAKWNPTTLIELHGFIVGSRTSIMVEPCTPPHEPDLEYDLFMNYAIQGAEAFGNAASLNTKYVATEDVIAEAVESYGSKWANTIVGSPWFEIPLRDYVDKNGGWHDETSDDDTANYTPTYALLHGTIGYTIECQEDSEESVNMHLYGIIGHTAYAAENKRDLFLNQLAFFKRAVNNETSEETDKWFVDKDNNPTEYRVKVDGKYYPEYYVIPVDDESQRNIAEAYEAEKYLIRNDVKVSVLKEDTAVDGTVYKAGSFVVNMHQAKRSMANVVLSEGMKLDGDMWTDLYSESVTNFPDLRGFDCDTIWTEGVFDNKLDVLTDAVDGKSIIKGTGTGYTVIENDGIEAVNAVNDLLAAGVKVGFVTKASEGAAAGDFVINYSDFDKINTEYVLKINNINTVPTAKCIIEPKLYLDGGSFDEYAFTQQMNFKTAKSIKEANVAFSSDPGDALVGAVKKGLPLIGASVDSLDTAKELVPGFDFSGDGYTDWWGDFCYNAYEALFAVDMDAKSPITASKVNDGDDLVYTITALKITSLPDEADVIMSAKKDDDFYKAGWMSTAAIEDLKGAPVAFNYKSGDVDTTFFTISLTNKAHQSDDYVLAANAIYSKLLGGSFSGKNPEDVTKDTVSLGAKVLTYNGELRHPKAIVKDVNGNTLVKGTDYKVSYKKNKNVGYGQVIITGIGDYEGMRFVKEFKINPPKTSIKSLAKGTKKFTVKYAKKSAQITGYQVRYSLKSAMSDSKKVSVKSASTTTKTIKNLKSGKKYYVQVRTYKTVDGVKYYSGWSTVKSVTVS